MALIIDPDDLNQGSELVVSDLVTSTGVGADIGLDATTMPALAAGEFFEIRDHSDPENNGLYQIVTVNSSTTSYEADKVTGSAPVVAASESVSFFGATGAATEKSVMLDTLAEKMYLLEQGNLSVDGATQLAIHSFIKKRWKDDQFLIDSGSFPITGISSAAGQWVYGQDPSGNFSDWRPENDVTFSIDSERLIRNAGWQEIDNAGVTQRRFFNVTTLGLFEDTADQAYYFFGNDFALDNTINYAFTGPVNEAVKFYDNVVPADAATGVAITTSNVITRNDAGDFVADGFVVGGGIELANSEDPANDGLWVITVVTTGAITVSGTPLTNNAADTTMTMAIDNQAAFTTNLRIRDADPEGKTFSSANLTSAGETALSAKIIKFPLANATDLDITSTDGAIAGTPWSEVRLRYLDQAYNRAVDSATLRDFGIVVDVGTYSGSNGVSNGTTTFTEANFVLGAGEALADYTGGTLTIHDATAPDRTTHTIVGTPTAPGGVLTIVVSSALTNSETSLSFTMDRATPLTATRNQIYEKIQFQLRQATDIDETDGTVIGKMAGPLSTFVGPDITFGFEVGASVNPNGGGTGVIVEGFDANDTNNMFFVDNTSTKRNFPFVAAGNLVFNSNLTNDSDPEYWLYYQYTRRTTNSDIDTVGPAGDTYDLEGTLGTYLVNDYLRISGFAQAANNGLFIVTVVNVSTSDYTVRRVDGEAVGTAETNQTVSVDENPFNSPDAIIVDNNAGADIVGAAVSSTVAFDFDYDNNVQGGRTAATDAVCVLKAIGLETAQFAQVLGLTITRNTGLSFSITAALERNFTP